MSQNLKVECPTCRKRGEWFAGRDGPFCSERCRLVDLGKWFNEEPRISEPLRPDHFQEYEQAQGDLDAPENSRD